MFIGFTSNNEFRIRAGTATNRLDENFCKPSIMLLSLLVIPLSADNRRYLLILLLLTSALYFTALGSRDFWAPVEPRYAEIVRVMFDRGEWVVPRVNGEIYTDKPILFFWLVLFFSKLAGAVNEWTVRLPAALGGIGFVVVTFFIGRDVFSVRVGFIGAAVLATSMRVIWEARWAHVDMVFCFVFAFALYCFARAIFSTANKYEILFGYLFMGLAVLTKGLIGVVLPGLVVGGYLLATRDWHLFRRVQLPMGMVIFLIITVPWFYLVNMATDGRWLSEFLWVHHFDRFTAGAGHRQPFYYYLTTLPVDFLPWTVFALSAALQRRSLSMVTANRRQLFLLIWFAAIFLFFSLSNTKRDLYLLPLFPPLAIFTAIYLDGLFENPAGLSSLVRWLCSAFFTITVIGVLLPPLLLQKYLPGFEPRWLPACLAIAISASFAAYFSGRNAIEQLFVSLLAVMTVIVLSASLFILPSFEPFKSPRSFAATVNQLVPRDQRMYIYADSMHDFNYYLCREVVAILPSPAELKALLASSPESYILFKARDFNRMGFLPSTSIVAGDRPVDPKWLLIGIRR